jgi:hypothetical protein
LAGDVAPPGNVEKEKGTFFADEDNAAVVLE